MLWRRTRLAMNQKEETMSAEDLASKARKHWAEWLPERTAELKAAGTFGAEAMAAAQMAQQEIDRLIASGYQEHEAEEVVLQQFIEKAREDTARHFGV